MTLARWTQYLLDHFEPVADAVDHVGDIRITDPPTRGQYMGTHIALEDATARLNHLEPIGAG